MSPSDSALELYKLEYQQATRRYDDIYRSAWTNFSYLTVVAGAIITFGKDSLGQGLAAFLASLPLFFWYLASFVPLNGYGDLTVQRLVAIEGLLNQRYGTRLSHYSNFIDRHADRPRLRVRKVAWWFFLTLYITTGWLLYHAWLDYATGTMSPVRELKNPGALVERLQIGQRPIDRYLRTLLSPELRQLLTRYRPPNVPTVGFQHQLVTDLNRVLGDGAQYGLNLSGLMRTYPTEIVPRWPLAWQAFLVLLFSAAVWLGIGMGMCIACRQAYQEPPQDLDAVRFHIARSDSGLVLRGHVGMPTWEQIQEWAGRPGAMIEVIRVTLRKGPPETSHLETLTLDEFLQRSTGEA